MSSISIIGAGDMARALGTRAVEGGNTVEVIGRDAAKAADLARALGATAGTFGTVPAGDIVILAVPYAAAVPIVRKYGDALTGKVIVDITNPFAPDFTTLVTPEAGSSAQEIAGAAPTGTHVVKAFNTVFGNVLAAAADRALDVLIAGDDKQAKASVSAFVESIGLRPLDSGPLQMARMLEGTGLLMMGLGRHGVRHYNFSLGVDILG
jgi:8-hydroxy-5-deazaflavin:NADPH oxidoreductase